jgi:hypothetical protein
MRLPRARRAELEALATETGLSTADLARLGINWLLEHREVLLSGREQSTQAQERAA